MPTHVVRCESDGREWEVWWSIHSTLDDEIDLGLECYCGGQSIVQIFTPPVVRSAAGRDAISKDAVLAQDLDAYRHLRGNGLQPKGIDGARHLENHASTQFEVETGVLFPDASAKKQVAEARKRADDYQTAVDV